MLEKSYEHSEKAEEFRDSGELARAGDLYTASAHERVGEVTEHSFPSPITHSAVGELCYAATCYRIAGDEFRTRNRCEMGTLLAEDYIEYIERQEFEDGSYADLRRSAWPEFIGDLRTIAGRDDAEDAYDEARAIYDDAGEWQFHVQEQEHMRLVSYLRSIKRGLGKDIPEDAIEENPLGWTFTEWLEYKRAQLPDLLEQLEAQGEWPTG